MFDITLRTFLINNNVLTDGDIQMNKTTQGTALPYINYERTSKDAELFNNGAASVITEEFNVDIYAGDPTTAQTVSNNVRALLHGYHGAVSTDFAMMITVDDQSDDYTPYLLDNDDGIFYASLVVKIVS